MKALLVLTALFVSISAFATQNQDFYCESLPKSTDRLEIRFVDGVLSYEDGRITEVAIASKSINEKTIKVSGLSKGLIFAGGGRQSVSVSVDLKSKKGSITIYTKTFYRTSEVTQELTCTF